MLTPVLFLQEAGFPQVQSPRISSLKFLKVIEFFLTKLWEPEEGCETCVGLFTRISQEQDIQASRKIIHKLPVAMAWSWQQCNMLCTSCFVDDVMFTRDGPCKVYSKWLTRGQQWGQSLMFTIAVFVYSFCRTNWKVAKPDRRRTLSFSGVRRKLKGKRALASNQVVNKHVTCILYVYIQL